MTLRSDLVLVKLPPSKQAARVKLIGADLDTWMSQKGIDEFQRLLKHQPTEQPIGLVVQVGAATRDVWAGDVVLLEPEAGQDLDLPDDRGLPWPHLLVRERDISAILESERPA